jgi:wyosine [tRNA(Phe)-imidazoG37] synthetase (radical SAM superfamily)
VGREVRVWEPTFREAADWRDQLEGPGCRTRLLPLGEAPSRPFPTVVYGPVRSRRLGRSLGINLSPPGVCVCSFDCVYCEFRRGRRPGDRLRWPSPDDVALALADSLPRCGRLDSITISGHGEPTLHPRFDAVVKSLLAEARRARPDLPVRILSNATGALLPGVRHALDLLDERIVKLDAGAARVSRPAGQPPGALLAALCLLRDFVVQACFVEGVVSNTQEPTVQEWIELVGELGPRSVQVYTIDRPPARAEVYPVPSAQLEAIARRLERATGIRARAYG